MDNRNLLLAVVLSLAILLGFELIADQLGLRQPVEPEQQTTQQQSAQQAGSEGGPGPATGDLPSIPGGPEPAADQAGQQVSRDQALAAGGRVEIDTPSLSGSISLVGGRLDDLVLKRYHRSIDPASPQIVLLSPPSAPQAYYAGFGWSATGTAVAVPTPETVWQADGDVLAPGRRLTLTWDNGQGLRFERVFEVDPDYLFTVTQRVVNDGDSPVTLSPYSLISRRGTPEILGFYILHEGLIGVFNDTLEEIDYDDLQDDGAITRESRGGWLGITDKYWLVSLIPDQSRPIAARFLHRLDNGVDKYQTDFLYDGQAIPAGATAEVTSRLFAGAKVVELLDRYQETNGIPLFDRAVDFGWFYFLTKPLFYALHHVARVVGNYGIAILILTVAIKLLFFPLANKSYRAMAKMRKVQPEMMRLREKHADDKQKLNQEMMALYKKEGANPMSGCLPILIQIPVFFALYKVLFVTIEMRHAPFFGWVQDLSARDPTSILNGFGLLPWAVPNLGPLEMLSIGVWPLLMGATMFLQQKLNPQPADPVQAKVFMFMPIIFTFLLATFPAGLVIYWTWNNLLSIIQQYVIMKRAGVPIGSQPAKT